MVIMTMMEMTVVSNVRGEDLMVNCLNREKMLCEKNISRDPKYSPKRKCQVVFLLSELLSHTKARVRLYF